MLYMDVCIKFITRMYYSFVCMCTCDVKSLYKKCNLVQHGKLRNWYFEESSKLKTSKAFNIMKKRKKNLKKSKL